MVFGGQFHWCYSSLKSLNPRTGPDVQLQEFGSSENSVLFFFTVFSERYPEGLWACNYDTLSDSGRSRSISNHLHRNLP